jgi:hypothetical protein
MSIDPRSTEPTSRRPAECLSDLALDSWLAGEGSASERASWQAHVDGCDACARRHAQRLAFNQRYLGASRDLEVAVARFGAARAEAITGPRPEPARAAPRRAAPRRAAMWLGGGALAAAASLALWLTSGAESEQQLARSKGSARIDFFVKSGGAVRPGAPGESVRAGDALRFVVPRAESRYLVILGHDSRGVSSVYFPAGPQGERVPSSAEPIGSGLALPSSVLLDDAPGSERLFAVFCDEPPAVADLLGELDRGGELSVRDGCEVVETHVTKAAP